MSTTLVARALVALILGGTIVVAGGPVAAASSGTATAQSPTTVLRTTSIISPDCRRTYLHYGSRGRCVTQLQFAMNLFFGRDLALDGIYGSATTGAVYWFQARYGLAYDGRCGPETWSKLLWVEYRFSHGLPF